MMEPLEACGRGSAKVLLEFEHILHQGEKHHRRRWNFEISFDSGGTRFFLSGDLVHNG